MKTPSLKIKTCPECGGDVELFSTDVKIDCEKCGFTVFNDIQNCVQWCKYAEMCVGEKMFKKLKKRYVVFLSHENALRGQMAEAIANHINTEDNLIFRSAGKEVPWKMDSLALRVLDDNNIKWDGKPEKADRIPAADMVITIDCQLEEFISGDENDSLGLIKELLGIKGDINDNEVKERKVIFWPIEDPREMGLAEYQKTYELIQQWVKELLAQLKS